jgi:hypothetical protein
MSQLHKALTTTGTGANLLPYDLDPALHEELSRLQPLAELIPFQTAKSKTHEFTRRTSHPLGWFEGESTPANVTGNTYERKSTMLKIQRIWGSVTGFAQSMTDPFIDALATELTGSLEGMSDLMEFGVLHGAANDLGFSGDAYQYSGLLTHIYNAAPQNVVDGGGAKVTLAMLDAGLARVGKFRQSRNDPKLWMMGLTMKQIVDGLQTRVQIPLTSTVLADGQITMGNYAQSPIFESDNVVPETVTTSPTATGSVGANGTLDGTFTYRVASVTAFGEQVAGVATAALDATAGTRAITLSWTADALAKSYYIFRKTGSGAFQLLDIIAAKTYDAAGTVSGSVATYVDAGARAEKTGIKPLETGEEIIALINRNPERGANWLGKIDDMGQPLNNAVSFVELARVKDTYDYMLKSYLGMLIRYPLTCGAVIRNVKKA